MSNTPATHPAPASLAVRLTLWYAGTSFAIVLAATSMLYWALVTNLVRQDDQFLVDEAHIIQDLLTERPEYVDAIRQEIEWEAAARRYARVYVRLLNKDGGTIVETPQMNDRLPIGIFPSAVDTSNVTAGNDCISTDGIPYRVISVTTAASTSNEVQTIQIAMDRVQQQELIANYGLTLVSVLIVCLIVSSIAAYLIANRGLKPIADVTATAHRVRSTTLHERMETGRFPRELTSLVNTFNEMLDRLQESFERLSRFSADIAHELRTPVNNMRGEAEVALSKSRSSDHYRDSLVSNLEETVRLSRIIDSLLLLSRAESPATELEREPVDLSAELERLREFYDVLMTETNIQWVVQSPASVMILANRPLLQRAIGNLIENALNHTSAGGTIAVSAIPDAGSQSIRIEVADNGSGIPSEDLPHVFDRFYRVQKDRSSLTGGSGLGLAIVRSVVELHGGEVSVDSQLGCGTTVVIELPGDISRTDG